MGDLVAPSVTAQSPSVNATGVAEASNVVATFSESVQTATTVRVRNGSVSVTDGPFAETKEQLAGFYLIEAKDLEYALK